MRVKTLLVISFVFYGCHLSHPNNLLIGNWAISSDENVALIIDKYNVTYFDVGYSYSYKLEKDRFVLFDSNKVIVKFRVAKLSKDSLILISENEDNIGFVHSYYKVK